MSDTNGGIGQLRQQEYAGLGYQNQAQWGGLGVKAQEPLTSERVHADAKRRAEELQTMVDTGEAAKPELEKLKRVLAAFEEK